MEESMAITYTWKVTNLKKLDSIEGLSDVAVHARWTRTGTDADGYSGEFNGATPLRLPDSGSSNFTPFEELSEEQVIEWIKGEIASNMGYEEHIVTQITKQINAKKNPIVEVNMLPWGVQAVGISPDAAPGEAANLATQSPPRYADSSTL
jgi:hypothetical protein